MVLKRLIVTALGALGLGALVAGPASAQEIPAPDLFDGQVACSMNVPTPPKTLVGRNKDGDRIGITEKIHSNMGIAVNADGTLDTADDLVPSGDDAALADILYVINPMNSNCGAGTYSADEATAFNTANNLTVGTDDDAVEAGDPKPVAAGVASDVGAGYTATLELFQKAVEADDDVAAKQKTLNMLLNDETADVEQTTLITNARTELGKSQTKQAEAHNALYAATGPDRDGSIYRAGVAEWRAKNAVEKAIGAWNTAVEGVTTAGAAAQLGDLAYNEKYVPLRNTAQIDGLVDASGNVNIANLRTYANIEGNNSAVQDATTGVISDATGSTGSGNFDAAGRLLVPMSDQDPNTDGDQLGPTKAATSTYSAVNTRITTVNTVVKALKKLQSENENALLQPVIDEAVRRAELEQAHYQAQFDAMIADNTNLTTVTDDPATPNVNERTAAHFSIKSRYDAYQKAVTKRDNAGVTLETAVQMREAATKAVRAAFTNPQSFYQQLVDRRQYLKNNADMEVTRLAGLTGDDAPTAKQTADAAEAAADAQKALDEATTTLASFQDMIDEGSPVRDLVLETLKPNSGDDRGDDGQELVDAIVGVNKTAADAKTAADEAKTTADSVSEMIEGLTGDDGAVSTNTRNISANTTSIDAIEEELAVDENGMSRIDHNESRSMTNATNIATNSTNIANNAANIMTNTMEIGYGEDGMSRIDHNEARSMQNATDVMTNAGNIAMNSTMIGENKAAIGMNASAIQGLDGRVGSNESSIMSLRSDVGELNEALEVVRAGVAASMALAGMPAINGRGISIGVGSYDGESAFAVGFQIQSDMASFKVGVTSAGGETGASAGVGFQF